MIEKTVTLSLDEYNKLLQDQKDKQKLIEEIKNDAPERGYLVEYVTHYWRGNDSYGWDSGYHFIQEMSKVEIQSKDEVLAKAQEEIERLSKLCVEHEGAIQFFLDEIDYLRHRGFVGRLFNAQYFDEMYERFKALHLYDYRKIEGRRDSKKRYY